MIKAMNPLMRRSIFVLSVMLVASAAATAQPRPENSFNPPNWIWGEWSNLSTSEPNKIERIVFSENEIELVQNLADPGITFTRKFKKYEIQETAGDNTYRLVVSNSKEELIWEFKFCPPDQCNLMTGDALTYHVMKNKKKLWDHSNSFNKILIRRTRPSARVSPANTGADNANR